MQGAGIAVVSDNLCLVLIFPNLSTVIYQFFTTLQSLGLPFTTYLKKFITNMFYVHLKVPYLYMELLSVFKGIVKSKVGVSGPKKINVIKWSLKI